MSTAQATIDELISEDFVELGDLTKERYEMPDKLSEEEVDIESIPAMVEIIDQGINTPWEECTVVPEDVYNAV